MGAIRKLFVLSTVLVAGLAVAGMSVAGHNDGCPSYNPNCNQQDDGGDGNSNTNENDNANFNTAFGGDGGRGGDATAGALAAQGQIMGQAQGTDVDTTVVTSTNTLTSTGTATSTNTATETNQGQDNDVSIVDNSVYEDARNVANSAAMVWSSLCGRGASAQGAGFGASIAFTNEICDIKAAATLCSDALAFLPVGHEARAGLEKKYIKLVIRAVDLALSRANPVRVQMQKIPLIGQFM